MTDPHKDISLATYLDEAGEDPASSCKNLNKHNINYVMLRHVWAGNIIDLSDSSHARLKGILNEHSISVIGLATDLGKVNASKLNQVTDKQIEDVANISRYYNANMVRVFVGNKDNHFKPDDILVWMQRISNVFQKHGITPLLEVTPDSCYTESIDIADLMHKNKYWKILYDPVNFILKKNVDPFVRHWTLLKQFVRAIDIRDLKIGSGFKPPGMGDSKIELTLHDSINNNYNHWYIIEPSLGRRHGQGRTKEDTFGFAIEGLNIILNSNL